MPDALTIGVAIAVPDPRGSELRRRRAGFGDPMAATVPSHITLLPPEEVAAGTLADLQASLVDVAARTAPFRVRLRGTGTFRPVSPVVFVAVSEGTAETELLAAAIRRAVGVPEAAFPFHPHVTVAHHLDDDALDTASDELCDFECVFDVAEFALYLHDDAAGWRRQVGFPLADS